MRGAVGNYCLYRDPNNNGYVGTTDTFTVGSRVILGTAFGAANVGWGCSPNGAIAANANGSGQVLACQGGSWQAMGSSGLQLVLVTLSESDGWEYNTPGNPYYVGWYKLCLPTVDQSYEMVAIMSGPNSSGQYLWGLGAAGQGPDEAECFN